MKQFKHLITSGCSFSDPLTGTTWPLHLSNTLKTDATHTGLCSQGNGLIARKAIYAVHNALKQGYKPDEILVGIMWSGSNRHDSFVKQFNRDEIENHKKTCGWLRNPEVFVDNAQGGWILMNPWWNEKHNKIYYSGLHDNLGGVINTYEKILWVQNYLKNLGINYFMSAFHPDTYSHYTYDNDDNIIWMKEQVDTSHWLPITTMHDWVTSKWSEEHFLRYWFIDKKRDIEYLNIDVHPTRKMHVEFTKDIILSFLINKFNDYSYTEFDEYLTPNGYFEPYGSELKTKIFEKDWDE
jgi:hypothetical protein